MKTRPSTFRAKLWRYFALFAAVVLALLWVLQTVFLQAFYDQSIKDGVRDAAAKIEHAWTEEDPSVFSATLDDVAADRSLLVFVATWDADVLYSTDEHSAAYSTAGTWAEKSPDEDQGSHENASAGGHDWVQDAQNDGSSASAADNTNASNDVPSWQAGKARQIGLTQGFSSFLERLAQDPSRPVEYQDEDGSLYTYGIALPAQGAPGSACETAGTQAVLYLNTTLQPMGAAVSTIRVQLLFATAASLALAFVLAFALARGFSRPVEQLTRKAGELGSGERPAEADGGFQSGFCAELDELSNALDTAADNLARQEADRAEFMANVSHDLRTPLTLIKGYAEAARDDIADGLDVDEGDLEIIAREADRLSSLASELLDYSKLKAGGTGLEMSEFDASEAFGSAAALFAPLCERLGILLDVRIDKHIPFFGDEAQLVRVVSNFIDNAASHTPEGGEITVSLHAEDGVARLEVRNSGSDISADELDRIWDRYFTRTQAKRNAKGSGLGLAISKEILEAHEMPYGVASEPGKGTTFWFERPPKAL